jgi:hypothetical protein
MRPGPGYAIVLWGRRAKVRIVICVLWFTSPGGAASLVETDDDDSKPGVCVKSDEMYQYLRNQVVKAIELLPQDEKACDHALWTLAGRL